MNRLNPIWKHGAVASLAIALLSLWGCATNPATGKPQIALISEQQEIEMGREYDQQIQQQLGLYQDPKLQDYVNRVGQKLAAASERPNLPWTFRVIDDPVVNAFAIPGGHVYVTRGLMTHLTSEAELASVLGHEIGHVTARHSVEQMSKQQLAQIGLLAGMIVSPTVAQYGNLAAQGLQVMFLKYSRDDERQADSLGLRYMYQQSYDPREMPQVFETLRRVSQAQPGGGRIPNWLSTHPTEEERIRTISGQVAKLGGDFSNRTVNREGYVRTLDNVVFGQNPREGYFVGNTFIQPDLGIQMQFPSGWKTSNERSAVGAISPNQDALVVVSLSDQRSAAAAAQQFFSQQGIQTGQSLQSGSLPAVSRVFSVQGTQSGDLQGIATFVENGGKVFQILGYTTAQNWRRYDDLMQSSIATFGPVTDRRALDVQPKRVDVVSLPSPMTLAEFAQRYPSTVDLDTLAIINQADANTRFAAGEEVKRVVGGELPTQAELR